MSSQAHYDWFRVEKENEDRESDRSAQNDN